MLQTDASSPPPPLQLTSTETTTNQLGLNEQRSQQGDVELVWEREQHRLKEREEIQNKFATLFEPPTPRASPTLLPSSLPPAAADTTNLPLFGPSQHTTVRRNSSRIFHPSSVPSYSSSDFGSFVEATEDPLSFALAHKQPGEGRSTGDVTPSTANTGKVVFITILSCNKVLNHSYFLIVCQIRRGPPSIATPLQ